jgi:hypothetical protein
MVKNSVILSVSIPIPLAEFCDYAKVSPSSVLQEALFEQKKIWDTYNTTNGNLIKVKEALEEQCQELYTFLEESKHIDQYRNWHNQLKGGPSLPLAP